MVCESANSVTLSPYISNSEMSENTILTAANCFSNLNFAPVFAATAVVVEAASTISAGNSNGFRQVSKNWFASCQT